MHTMVVTMKIDPSRRGDVDRHLREDVAPWARRQPGFVNGQWVRLAQGGRGLGLVVFESEEHATAAAQGPGSQPWVEGRAWNTESVEVFEQVASA
jgi:hypothetical protein